MLQRVTLADCSDKLGDYLESRLSHQDLLDWVREAMIAVDIPPHEHAQVMDLLQDISVSTPQALASAAKNYRVMHSPLVKGTPMERQNRPDRH
jgi:hypothetical protein